MNPKEFGWSEHQQVTVTNPTKDDHNFQVHGKKYTIGKGQTVKVPGFIAWVYVYEMALKLAQADDKFGHWNDENFRPQYYEKVVVGVDPEFGEPEPEAEPEVTTFQSVPVDAPSESAKARADAKQAKSAAV